MSKTTIKDTSGLKQAFGSFIKHKREQVAAELTGEFLHGVIKRTINGSEAKEEHAVESWLQIADQAQSGFGSKGAMISEKVEQFNGSGSNDPEVQNHVSSFVDSDENRTTVKMFNELGFVSTLETGGTITVGDLQGNRGPKAHGRRGPGPLFGPREQGSSGLLMWVDKGGTTHFSKTRSISAGNFVNDALERMSIIAQRKGIPARNIRRG